MKVSTQDRGVCHANTPSSLHLRVVGEPGRKAHESSHDDEEGRTGPKPTLPSLSTESTRDSCLQLISSDGSSSLGRDRRASSNGIMPSHQPPKGCIFPNLNLLPSPASETSPRSVQTMRPCPLPLSACFSTAETPRLGLFAGSCWRHGAVIG